MLEPRQRLLRASADSTSTSPFNEWRIISIVPLLVLSFLSTALFNTTPALAYSCGNPNSGHCYGQQDWPGPVTGSQTTINIANLSCKGGCITDGFVDDEMWFIDEQTSACTLNQYGACWVEIGYENDGVSYGGSTYHFWADIRPVDKSLNVHPIGITTWSPVVYTIESFGNNEFQVGYVQQGGCHRYCNYYTYSTSNSMKGNDIHIGQELAGSTGGASASRADFTNNNWQNVLFGSWHRQQSYGNGVRSDDPPYAAWVNNSVSSNDFHTNCC